MSRRRSIGLKDQQRVLELASQGLSARQIAQRMGIRSETVHRTLAKGLTRCGRCARTITTGHLCAVCRLPANATFGERLRAFRTAAGVSQLWLALKIGVSNSQLRLWENSQRQPAEHELQMLAQGLERTVQELTGIAVLAEEALQDDAQNDSGKVFR
jgi:transcriptional regulator with XRE-family HTH domain